MLRWANDRKREGVRQVVLVMGLDFLEAMNGSHLLIAKKECQLLTFIY